MHFTKMHGLGNDYLYIYGEPVNPETLSIRLSERHFGVGSDGMIWISPSKTADFKMRIFNADGSEAKMCGNGIRCVGKYVYEKGYTDQTELHIETMSGIRTLHLQVVHGKVSCVSVDMGIATAKPELTLESYDTGAGPKLPAEFLHGIPVSVGNPHFVLFIKSSDELSDTLLTTVGLFIEHHPAFPGGVNVEFIQVLDSHNLRMRVWERGSGITMACGTGACASVMAAVSRGFCHEDEPVSVHLDGGTLQITIDSLHHVTMTGPAEFICEGETID